MSAYNWIVAVVSKNTDNDTTTIRCQTHIASSYEGNDSGRFHDKEYKLGEKMAWWQPLEPKYRSWRDGDNRKVTDDNEAVAFECCLASSEQNDSLYAVIKFENLVPVEIVEFGNECDWPEGFWA